MIPVIEPYKAYRQRPAIRDAEGIYTYQQLYEDALTLAAGIRQQQGAAPGPVLFLFPSGYSYVVALWAIWLSGGIAVPVHVSQSEEELRYLLSDTGASLFLCAPGAVTALQKIIPASCRLFSPETLPATGPAPVLPEVLPQKDCLMIYTSGTTGRPKGVVMTHLQLEAQVRSLSIAWAWQATDHILNVLPMHHVHGVINITCCALYNGALCTMESRFDPAAVAGLMSSGTLTLFMAVPTIYHKLLLHYESLLPEAQAAWKEGMRRMRLMVSGSAALPVPLLRKWQALSGHILLERYGMTETGMILSNPLHGERIPGYVGQPLPFVQVRLVDEQGVVIHDTDTPGEIYVRGDTVFQRYWQKPEETALAFDRGWFKTGDIAARDASGNYRILGRNSSDIIKSGGYKISALELENKLLEHPLVKECAVVALPDEVWGERIAAALAGPVSLEEIQQWFLDKVASYKMPRTWMLVEALPRNAMGKVLKKEVQQIFSGPGKAALLRP